jgi:hypothetical protein
VVIWQSKRSDDPQVAGLNPAVGLRDLSLGKDHIYKLTSQVETGVDVKLVLPVSMGLNLQSYHW